MDPIQILLFTVVVTLTGLLVVIGIQSFFLLRQAGVVLERLNKLLTDLSTLSGSLAKPVVGFTAFLEGMRGIKSLMELVSTDKDGEKAKEGIRELEERGHRFFIRDGKQLTS